MFLSYIFDSQSQLQFLHTYFIFRIIEDFFNKRTRQERFLNVSREALTRALNCIYLQIFFLRFKTIFYNMFFLIANIVNALVLRIFNKVFFKIIKRKFTYIFTTIFNCRTIANFIC